MNNTVIRSVGLAIAGCVALLPGLATADARSRGAERSRLQADLTPEIGAGAKAATCPPRTGFGLGWQLLGFPGGTTMLHTGKDAGAFTFAAIDRASGDGIVILTNSDNGCRAILPILERTGSDPTLIAFLRGQMT